MIFTTRILSLNIFFQYLRESIFGEYICLETIVGFTWIILPNDGQNTPGWISNFIMEPHLMNSFWGPNFCFSSLIEVKIILADTKFGNNLCFLCSFFIGENFQAKWIWGKHWIKQKIRKKLRPAFGSVLWLVRSFCGIQVLRFWAECFHVFDDFCPSSDLSKEDRTNVGKCSRIST